MFAILLLNVMDLVLLEVLYWIDHVWFSIECVCCACGPSERLDAPSICLFVVCMSEVISSFKNLRSRSLVFAFLMLFLCVILHTMFRVGAYNCYASFPLVYCACLPSL